ncbi:MAG: type 4a pilus biogenesis protein PilO [Bryobacteraceae bacterium]
MNRNSEKSRGLAPVAAWLKRPGRNGRAGVHFWARVAVGVLLAADLIAAVVVFQPWGGSAQDLERRLATLRTEVQRRREAVERLRSVAAKMETARQEAEKFVSEYFLDRRTVSSTLLGELDELARQAGIKPKEASYQFEPIEGSQGLSIVTIHAGFEGTYGDLMHFLNLLDRSPRLLILSDLQAAPQASGLQLNVTMKLNAFVREQAGPVAMAAQKEVSRP